MTNRLDGPASSNDMKQSPFWDDGYSQTDVSTMGTPNFDLVMLARDLPRGTVLDLGAGEGRNSLFLAGEGFSVDAVDISSAGMQKLAAIAARISLPIECRVADIGVMALQRDYEIIMAHGVIDYLERPDWRRLVADLKSRTRPGGLNIFTCMIFNDSCPAPPEFIAAGFKTSLELGELRSVYEDWDICRYEYYVKTDSHPGIGSHEHPVEKMVVQRPGPGPRFRPRSLPVGCDLADTAEFNGLQIGQPAELATGTIGPPQLQLAAAVGGPQFGVASLRPHGVNMEMWFYGHYAVYIADGVVAGKARYLTDPTEVVREEDEEDETHAQGR